jgi:hypothetical protein
VIVTENETRCANCSKPTPIDLLDAKPARLAGPGDDPILRLEELIDALYNNEDCDRLECEACYGPGWQAPGSFAEYDTREAAEKFLASHDGDSERTDDPIGFVD